MVGIHHLLYLKRFEPSHLAQYILNIRLGFLYENRMSPRPQTPTEIPKPASKIKTVIE